MDGGIRFERKTPESVTDAFAAIVRTLALRRWDPGANLATEIPLPERGCRYRRQTDTALREGTVVEVIRPVSITLQETLHDPPCRVRLKQRWRLHTVTAATVIRLELQYTLNRAAALRQIHWRRRLQRHGEKLLGHVARNLEIWVKRAEKM